MTSKLSLGPINSTLLKQKKEKEEMEYIRYKFSLVSNKNWTR